VIEFAWDAPGFFQKDQRVKDATRETDPAVFQNQSAFLIIGAGITPLSSSIFVTELAPMIWRF